MTTSINLYADWTDQACSVALRSPMYAHYVPFQQEWDGVTLFCDGYMYRPSVRTVKSRDKVGWLIEGRCLHPELYDAIDAVAYQFDAILTHDAELLARGVPFLKTWRGGSWVPSRYWHLYTKIKRASLIISPKQGTEGHRLRHAIAAAGLEIDCFGPDYTPIGHDTALAYRDYAYAVVTEACREENLFTEHLIDPIACGCTVLYWGCPNVHEYLPTESIRPFRTIDDLAMRLAEPSANSAARKDALERARAYSIPDDWLVTDGPLAPFLQG